MDGVSILLKRQNSPVIAKKGEKAGNRVWPVVVEKKKKEGTFTAEGGE